jgi:hypothetical protein
VVLLGYSIRNRNLCLLPPVFKPLPVVTTQLPNQVAILVKKMNRAFSCSALALLTVAAVAKIAPRSLISTGADFASRDYDYVVIGGGTAGLVVAARYACLQQIISKPHL